MLLSIAWAVVALLSAPLSPARQGEPIILERAPRVL